MDKPPSNAEFKLAMHKAFADVPPNTVVTGDMHAKVMEQVESERKKWNEALYSPAGLGIIFRR